MSTPTAAQQSTANHTLLIQLADGQKTLGENFITFSAQQREENRVIHGRIDFNATQTAQGFSKLSEENASRGRVNASHVAVLIALLVGIGGFGNAMMEMKISNERPKIDANTRLIQEANADRAQLRAELVTLRVEQAAQAAAGAEHRRWLEKTTEAK